jgi:hypothetical protein
MYLCISHGSHISSELIFLMEMQYYIFWKIGTNFKYCYDIIHVLEY